MDVDVDVPAAGPSGSKPVSVISIPESQADEEELPPVIGEKRKRVDEEKDDRIATNNGKAKTTDKKSKKAKTATATADKTKKKGPAKKAKGRTVMSDDEDGGAMVVDPEPPASTTAPPPQTTVVSEPEVGDEENAKPAKSKRAKKFVVSDSDGEGESREEIVKPAKKPTKKAVISESEGEGNDPFENKPNVSDNNIYFEVAINETFQENSPPRPSSESQIENVVNKKPASSSQKKNLEETPKPVVSSISSRYTIASRTKSTPMAELIRRVNSRPGSPFPVTMPRRSSLGGSAVASTSASASNPGTPTTSYSPYHKFSRSALSRIAPLHPNRRTPPPPLPPPPPKPKTKKEKEREERWEEEMIEAVGGWDEWKNLSDQDQKAARRAKWAQELGGYDD
ncbi:hypothetical protein MVEN_02111700 [Mycena venus]|uniref:Uncharacterized protein n=1 Tax=Mycena venus TaxID=2733690 RepID=A0A8H6X8V9_9AGAR|nr:hypothetical protein MVEN_02111700 [Mycena venus]